MAVMKPAVYCTRNFMSTFENAPDLNKPWMGELRRQANRPGLPHGGHDCIRLVLSNGVAGRQLAALVKLPDGLSIHHRGSTRMTMVEDLDNFCFSFRCRGGLMSARVAR